MNKPVLNNYRFEKKFIIPERLTPSIEEVVKSNSALMRKIFCPRFINNIYFDNSRFKFFFENIDGVSERMKTRIRWYGNLKGRIKKPVLEFKQKHGLTGSKTSIALPSFDLKDIYHPGFLRSLFKNSNLDMRKKELMLSLTPSLINRYQRKYFLSFDHKFRVTLDNHLKYYPVSSPEQLSSCGLKDSLSMIMELKYSPIYQLESNNITQEFPFRVIKNSKYVRGIQIIYNLGTHI
jgi:SPX domain protein involved in polyphosphate accumulation